MFKANSGRLPKTYIYGRTLHTVLTNSRRPCIYTYLRDWVSTRQATWKGKKERNGTAAPNLLLPLFFSGRWNWEAEKEIRPSMYIYIYICGYRDSTEAHSCSRLDLQNSVSYIHLRPVVNRRCCYSTAGFSQSQMLYNRGITLYAPRVLLDVCFSLPPSVSFFPSSPPRGKKGRIFMDRAVNSST